MSSTIEDKAIDIAKLFFAYVVIGIHTNIFNYYSGEFEGLASTVLFVLGKIIVSVTVPFFFICAGYYFKPNGKYLPKQVLRLLPPYFFWSIVYNLALIVSERKIDAKGIIKGYLIASPGAAMWFIGAIIISFVILNRCRSKKATVGILTVSMILFLIGLGLDSYSGLFRGTFAETFLQTYYFNIFESSRNFVFLGLPFVSLGFFLGRYGLPKRITRNGCMIIFAVACLCTALEVIYLLDKPKPLEEGAHYFIFTPLAVASLLIFLLKTDIKSQRNYRYIRKLSSAIYYSHMTILVCMFILCGIAVHFGLLKGTPNNLIMFAVISCMATLFATLAIRINNKYLNKII